MVQLVHRELFAQWSLQAGPHRRSECDTGGDWGKAEQRERAVYLNDFSDREKVHN